jgi:hypothetical protein
MKRSIPASLLGALCAALAPVAALASAVPLTALPGIGTFAANDLIPIQSPTSPNLNGTTVSQLRLFISPSFGDYAAKGDAIADDTSGVQAALNAGTKVSCNGVYRTTATLVLTAPSASGLEVVGSGATGDPGTSTASTPGKCVIRPDAGVNPAIRIDGAPFSGYVTGVKFADLDLDMVNMAVGSVGFSHGQEYDTEYHHVRVLNDTGKTSWKFGPGAYTTLLDHVQGAAVYCLGNGTNNPTTITLINPDIKALNAEQCASVTTIGGAVQPIYSAGVTTVHYIAPGVTNLLGFYPTTQALWAATGGTPAGMYIADGSYTLNAQAFTSLGTDWEAGSAIPSACTISGSSWAFGSYNDGTHGCLPIVWDINIAASTQGCDFTNPLFAGMYLYEPALNGCNVRDYHSGSQTQNISNNANIFSGPIAVYNAQAIRLYSDGGLTQTGLIDASIGALNFQSLSLHPSTAGDQFFCLYDVQTTPQCVVDMSVNSSAGSSAIRLNFGAQIVAYTDAETTLSWGIDNNGLFKGYAAGSETWRITSANGIATFAAVYNSGNQVVGPRVTGFTAGTGTANKGAFAAYAGQTYGATYSQTAAQATDDAAAATAQRLLAIEQALRAHGLIN